MPTTSEAPARAETIGHVPSLAHGVANPRALGEVDDESGAEPWIDAPATSHIYRFRFYDARKYTVLKKFGGLTGTGSILYVQFINRKDGKVSPIYQYTFRDLEQGARLFQELRNAAHPYGDVFLPKIRNNPAIPYAQP